MRLVPGHWYRLWCPNSNTIYTWTFSGMKFLGSHWGAGNPPITTTIILVVGVNNSNIDQLGIKRKRARPRVSCFCLHFPEEGILELSQDITWNNKGWKIKNISKAFEPRQDRPRKSHHPVPLTSQNSVL